ncbi:response regulator [Brevundimonas kwangchunensis]|uniref:Response regulator n=1 Tax=Brevundimonas kwangchunensis TaxID=322163 RepID=A0ABP3S381_9CAUL
MLNLASLEARAKVGSLHESCIGQMATDPHRVLLAEDDGLFREALRARLTSNGYEVHTARTGNEALQRVLTLQPHVLVLDINMPELDGFGVLEALRANPPGFDVPVVVLSARRREEDVRRAVALGARDYIVKTGNDAELIRRIQRLMPAAA